MRMNVSFGTRSAIAFAVFVGLFLISPSRMVAQNPGQKAVYGPNGLTGSAVWVDASAWWNGTSVPDLCSIIQLNILTSGYGSSYLNGTVIDARGLAYGVQRGTQTACSVNPFGALTGPPPSTTLLLPSGFVDTNVTWVVPNNTTLIGDEQGTTIRARDPQSGDFQGSYIIEMGGTNTINGTVYPLCPGGICTGVGVEHLFLDGSLVTDVGGIQNQYSQDGSYVNEVNLYSFSQTGLSIAAPSPGNYPGATNSGPYSNINFISNSNAPACIDLEVQTQGIHGVTCIGNSSTTANPYTAILVNASNNSIEDVHVEGYWDGIEVGQLNTATVANILISNVTGTTSGTGSNARNTKNTVHLCGPSPLGSTFGNCAGNYGTANVKDVTVLQAMNASGPQTTTVVDDVSKNAIISCLTLNQQNQPVPGCAIPLSTAMYVLGEPDAGSTTTNPAYTKFTSSPTTLNGNYNYGSSYMPTWAVWTSLPDQDSCSPVGAIYSQTGHNGRSVYVCNAGGVWITIR
jgi:hypothetical protein